MQESSPKASRVWLAALIVFGVALALRLVHLWALHRSFAGSDLFAIPLVDAKHHWDEALAILDGNPPMRDGVPWKGPGYSYFLAGLTALCGRSLGAVRWMLALLGSIIVPCWFCWPGACSIFAGASWRGCWLHATACSSSTTRNRTSRCC